MKSGRTFVRCGGDVRRARPSVCEERGVLGYLRNILGVREVGGKDGV